MTGLLTLGEMLATHARTRPDKLAAADSSRSLDFKQLNERACRLANALTGLGLAKGDRVAVLAFNCVEWTEIFAATAKSGLVAVPINFRLLGAEIAYIVQDAEAAAIIVQAGLEDRIESVRDELPSCRGRYIHFGTAQPPVGYLSYEALLAAGVVSEPSGEVAPDDPWAFMYTSGTTGKPKGAIRSHASMARMVLCTAIDQGFSHADFGLLVMPLCHSNSFWYATLLTYLGASMRIYDRRSIDPEHLLATLTQGGLTFTSLVPTHYIMLLSLPEALRARHRGNSVTKLLISSAPARRETKLAIFEQFPNSRLYEGYGSTEAGWVTVLHPEDQLSRLGSIGRETVGSARIRLLGPDGQEVPEGEVGELYSRTSCVFQGYWKLPQKTAEAFRGGHCSVGDMARRGEDGFYYLADRKSNMIISGGENVYPSEVENLLGEHPKIKDVAVIGVPHDKWGETVHAVIVLHDGVSATDEELLAWCRSRIAGYKSPKTISFVTEAEMPRTATGKLMHRVLRERYRPSNCN
jgi:acyl-CoA synthetase (AMP-forming)/AMP-acid ligase II